MIVVDTNVVAYLMIGGALNPVARQALLIDPEWAAPALWRSEFRSVLSLYLRRGLLDVKTALSLAAEAECVMARREYFVESPEVLRLVKSTVLSAYDCEFVALAMRLQLPLVTTDTGILSAVPDVAISLEQFANS
ncbi:MAG: type II toxin-antitoxin system VapC family toxin [Candidatus Riflebacteria bacterium]|nr:type II toxin-antitoxin system VapC family toxin [Candidatus Riflebacteria bacterium]